MSLVGRAVRRSGVVDFSPEQMQYLNFGRVVCNARLKAEFGYTPAYSTEQAFDDAPGRTSGAAGCCSRPGLDARRAAGLTRLLRLPGDRGVRSR